MWGVRCQNSAKAKRWPFCRHPRLKGIAPVQKSICTRSANRSRSECASCQLTDRCLLFVPIVFQELLILAQLPTEPMDKLVVFRFKGWIEVLLQEVDCCPEVFVAALK